MTHEEVAKTTADRAWDEVCRLERLAKDAESAAYYDPAEIIRARQLAEDAFERWERNFPAEALERRAAALERAAEASQTWDADGWRSKGDREQRYSQKMAEAAAMRAEAAALRAEAHQPDVGEVQPGPRGATLEEALRWVPSCQAERRD